MRSESVIVSEEGVRQVNAPRAAAYVRAVSGGPSCQEQEALIEGYASQQNLELVYLYVDEEPVHSVQSPGLAQMESHAGMGLFDGLIALRPAYLLEDEERLRDYMVRLERAYGVLTVFVVPVVEGGSQ